MKTSRVLFAMSKHGWRRGFAQARAGKFENQAPVAQPTQTRRLQ